MHDDARPILTAPEGLPELSLGYGVLEWATDNLRQPDGETAGQPFVFTREQALFVLNFYAIDENGRFKYNRATLRRPKGWGKSPFVGAICLAELCGPVLFDGFDAAGRPVGMNHPAPWVVLAGVSEEQTGNTYSSIMGMLDHGAPVVENYGLDVGLTRIYAPGGKLVTISASASTQEGARTTFGVADETHHWTVSNRGWDLHKVMRRNLAKVRGRLIETTNAHEPGMESVAERSYQAFLAMKEGRTRSKDHLYDSREASPKTDLANEESLRRGLVAAYGDSTWVDLDRLISEIYSPEIPAEESRRFYLNQIVAAADSWVASHEWGGNHKEDLRPLEDGDRVVLGFDGGRRDDSTALVALRVEDNSPWLLGIWEKPEGPKGDNWEVDKTAVRDAVAHAFSHYEVDAFHADVKEWETDVDLWRDEYGEQLRVKATSRHAVAYDMRAHQAEIVRAVEGLHRSIVENEMPHCGDERLTRHILNARRRPNRWGVSFGKETRESPKKVDALAALVLARIARAAVTGMGSRGKRTGEFFAF